MKSESPDAIIARLFEEERRADEAAAPDLARLLARSRRRSEDARAVRRSAFLAAALAATVAAALLVLRPARPRGPTPEGADIAGLAPAAVQLANWKAPTDAFLRTSGSDLWSRVPVLLPRESALETRTVTEPTKGVTP
jgi:hypothetical protein